jgi:hypothetical protein
MRYNDVRQNAKLVCTQANPWTCLECGRIYHVYRTHLGRLFISCNMGTHHLELHESKNGELLHFEKAAV